MSSLQESAKSSPQAEGSACNNGQTASQASPDQLSGFSPEQFHGKLLWDFWKPRRALLSASFLCNLSQKGIQSWLLIAWYVKNTEETFLSLFHKYHLQIYRVKTPFSHSRSHFVWRRVSWALTRGTIRLCIHLIPGVAFSPSEKGVCIFTLWGILRSLRRERHSSLSPQTLSFPSIEEGATDKRCIDSMQFLCILLSFSLGYSYQHWAKWTCYLAENVILVTCTHRTAAQPLNLLLNTCTGSSFPNHSRRLICALKKQVTFLILAWIPCSIINDLNYTALFTHRFMNMKYSD